MVLILLFFALLILGFFAGHYGTDSRDGLRNW